jgi:acetyl-CoA acetyltransferase family protein
MAFTKAFIPYGGYWSSPFSKWQGSLANLHAVRLAAETGAKFFEQRKIDPKRLDNLYFGITIPQTSIFYGGPWVAAMLGNDQITGPMIGQACITGVVCTKLAAQDIEQGFARATLAITGDRCSNGPHIAYASQTKPGATPESEDWVWDNFGHDPWAKNSMLQTAENVAGEHAVSREQMDEVTAQRYEQYQMALADDRAFQKRYMIPVTVGRGKKAKLVEADEGIFPTSLDGLRKLEPVMPEGRVTFGSQTHPADGNAGLIVTTREAAAEMSRDKKVVIQILGFGTARTKKGFMAAAMVPAAEAALADAGLKAKDMDGVKTHNPFAVNDIVLAKQLGLDVAKLNNYGCSLVWGHPQGPTALRSLIELIEELVAKGGGTGMFSGCAAGDTAAGIVVKVSAK